MLEGLVNTIEEEHSAEIKLQLLTAMMKLFFKRPPECQLSLGNLLAHCIGNCKQNVSMAEVSLCFPL